MVVSHLVPAEILLGVFYKGMEVDVYMPVGIRNALLDR